MRTIAIASALLLSSVVAHANLELTLHTVRISHPPQGTSELMKGGPEGPQAETLHVTLGRRIYLVDAVKHELDDRSLFAMVSSRETELQNRLSLGGALDQGNVQDNPMALTIVEHDLSMRNDMKKPSEVESVTAGGESRFGYKTSELLAWSTDAIPVKAAEVDQFVRFFRYVFGGHPEILAVLSHLDGIPKRLRISDPMAGALTQIDISEVEETPDTPTPSVPAGLHPAVTNPVIGAATAKVTSSTMASRKAYVADLVTAAGADAGAHKPLESMLGYLETTLITGGQLPQEFFPHKNEIGGDINVQALLGTLRPANEEQFEAALAKDPFLTGVWKDLGDTLRQTDHPEEAWHCYDTARLTMPGSTLLADIDKAEARMPREHPEYF